MPTVGVHDVDLRVAIAEGREDDLPAVGRIAPLGVVARRVGQTREAHAIGLEPEDVHARIEIPAIALGPAVGWAFLVTRGGSRVEVRGGEDQGLLGRMEEAASALPLARADELWRRAGRE